MSRTTNFDGNSKGQFLRHALAGQGNSIGEPVRRQRRGRGLPDEGMGHGPRGRGGHGGHGGWGGPPPWEWAGGARGRGRGPRVRRGDVRVAILDVLSRADDQLNGYQVIGAISDRTNGAWSPSPGSVYPTISQLEDEGLVTVGREDGKKVLGLTDAGRAWVEENGDQRAAIWTAFDEGEGDLGDVRELKQVLKQVMGAVGQVFATATPDQRARAVQILTDTRRQLYGVLADGPEDE